MKYIRTKDGIYEVDCEKYDFIGKEFKKATWGKSELVIKQADTIEELFDWLVYRPNGKIKYLIENIKQQDQCYDYEILDFENWYGAIETDKGLIYKAKMKGVLPNGEIDWELL